MYHTYHLNRSCATCGTILSDQNKSGYCNKHRDRTGKNNPFYGKTHKKETIEASKIKLREISINLWKNEEYRNKVITNVSKPRRNGFKKEQSERVTQWYKDNPEQRQIRSITMKNTWDSNKITPNIDGVESYRVSRAEILLYNILYNKYGDMVKRNECVKNIGILSGQKYMLPDIVFLQTDVVEYYGDYWHANPLKYNADDIVYHKVTAREIWDKDFKRISDLEESGYRVHIVWENDFKKNKDCIVTNLCASMDWDTCNF